MNRFQSGVRIPPMVNYRLQQEEHLVEKLKALKAEMEADPDISDDLFFFPEHRGVNGYWGTGSVWFVGEKPSKGGPGFPDSAVNLLYDTLGEFGFENAHITDLTKERGVVPDDGIAAEELARIRPYFQKEIDILEPTLLIAMSRNVESGLKFMAATDGIEIGYIHHYSWADGRGDRDVFIEGVRQYADRLGIEY